MKNVILFTIDTLRSDVLGCYGNTEGLSPFLDSLQPNATAYNRCQSVGPYTQASFPGILTSSFCLEHGDSRKLSMEATVVSQVLQRAGVTTAGFHSNPFLSDYFGWNRGWHHFYDSMDEEEPPDVNPYIKGDVINDKVDDWLGSHVTGPEYNRFFLWVHYMDVHEPYAPDKKYTEQIDPSLDLGEEEYLKLFHDVVLTRDASNPETIELLRKLYKAHVIEVDGFAKELFAVFGKHDVLKDSVVIITSDHGDEFGDHGSLSHDGKMYDELTHVPFVVYDESQPGGEKCDDVVSGLDVPPTILKLFGLPPEAKFKGQAVLPRSEYQARPCYGEAIGKLKHKIQPTDKPVHYCREDKIKIIHREEDDKWEMYDLEADPLEQNSIIDSSPLAEAMKEKLLQFARRNG